MYFEQDDLIFLEFKKVCGYFSFGVMGGYFFCIGYCNVRYIKRCGFVCIYFYDGGRCVFVLVYYFLLVFFVGLLYQVYKSYSF